MKNQMPDSSSPIPAWITIGSFDGVHLGHQALIRQLVESAHADHCRAVVVTFYPHPAVVLRKIDELFYLSSPEEKEELLRRLSVDRVITLPFTQELANLTPIEFMQYLLKLEQLRILLVGSDFALGRGRQGNPEVLAEIGSQLGYKVKVFTPIQVGDTVISSSKIRALLNAGEVDTARRMLGRPYSLTGQVMPGDARGRRIGIRTANVEFSPERLLPATGVYATWALISGKRYPSVTNIGVRPTFEDQPVVRRLETHVLDLDAELYGQSMTVEFVKFLRPEKRFEDAAALVGQIHQDIQQAREELSHER